MKLVLASKSPRRQELLKGLDIDFSVRVKDADESYNLSIPLLNVAEVIAENKAKAFVNEIKNNEIVITADTVVIVNNQILGKPKTKIQAFDMLSKLSNGWHKVVTGVCLQSKTDKKVFSAVTNVHFKPLTCDEMNYYLKKYKPFDKAGSYGIQEWIGFIGIDKIEGSYFNVMGLPVHLVFKKLLEIV
ncbi:MAG TPA: septum formation protein Maf [Crocinitomix sp.]|nr:septum formation protein Maf [Crocinitomix sp.]